MNIPKDLEQAIYSIETFEKLKAMWDEYHLDDEQQKALGNETGLYMTGKTKKDRFLPNLMFRMDINRSTAEKIKQRIDKEIIDPVRESFEKMQNEDELETSGIEIEKKTPEQNPTESDLKTSKDDVLEKIEDKKPESEENSNYSPLNIVKDDVLKGIEDPEETPSTEMSNEGTELDQKLDQILKKTRREVVEKETGTSDNKKIANPAPQSNPQPEPENPASAPKIPDTPENPVPDNLPTTDSVPTKPESISAKESGETEPSSSVEPQKPQKPEPSDVPKPKTQYPGGEDPYREPI